MTGELTTKDALIAALNAEYAAVYLYPLLAARSAHDRLPAETARWNAAYAAHRQRRDQLLAFLGADAPSPAVAYTPPATVTNASSRARCARLLEGRSEAIYAQLVGATTASQRAFAINALVSVSTAAVAVGQAPLAFPGLTL